jgi:hypothetical protein
MRKPNVLSKSKERRFRHTFLKDWVSDGRTYRLPSVIKKKDKVSYTESFELLFGSTWYQITMTLSFGNQSLSYSSPNLSVYKPLTKTMEELRLLGDKDLEIVESLFPPVEPRVTIEVPCPRCGSYTPTSFKGLYIQGDYSIPKQYNVHLNKPYIPLHCEGCGKDSFINLKPFKLP